MEFDVLVQTVGPWAAVAIFAAINVVVILRTKTNNEKLRLDIEAKADERHAETQRKLQAVMEERLGEKENQLNALRAKLEGLEKRLVAAEAEAALVPELRREVDALRLRLAEVSAELERERGLRRKEQEKATKLETRVEELTNLNNRAVSDSAHLQAVNSRLTGKVQELQQRIASLEGNQVVIEARLDRQSGNADGSST